MFFFFFFFFNDTATTEIYTLSLHDSLPICDVEAFVDAVASLASDRGTLEEMRLDLRSEEHTLNSSHITISYAVFCLKKKKATPAQPARRSPALSADSRAGRRNRPGSPRFPAVYRSAHSPPIFFLIMRRPPESTLFPCTTLFR